MGETKVALYGDLSGGFSDNFPYGTQRPTSEAQLPPFRDMQNMMWSQGALKLAYEWTALNATTYTKPTVEANDASRQETELTNAQYPVGGALISTSTAGQKSYIVITDGEVYVNGLPMNPTKSMSSYSEASLLAAGVKPNDIEYVSAAWRLVGVLASHPVTSTPFTVRRTFVRGTAPGKVSWALLNGDLYVAAQCAGVDPGGTSGWGILKIADVFGTPVEAVYIMATWNVTGALASTQIIDTIDEIVGLQATADGRLVILTNEDGLGNRVRWCSHRDVTKWINNEEASFTDIATANADGKCLSRIGETMVVYFADCIYIGTPTHQQHLPYTWTRSQATIGTRWYRGACVSRYGNCFVGSDGHFYAFDGVKETKLTDDTIRKYTKGPDEIFLTGETTTGDTLTITLSVVDGVITVA